MLNNVRELTDEELHAVAGGVSSADRWIRPGTYTLKPGDDLNKVAIRFGTTRNELLAHNRGIGTAEQCKPGDMINVPSV